MSENALRHHHGEGIEAHQIAMGEDSPVDSQQNQAQPMR